MTTRISKNLIKGKPYSNMNFMHDYLEGGKSAWSQFMGLKPVSVFASQQWFRLAKLIKSQSIFEVDRVHQHTFPSYQEMMDFLKENQDMIAGLDDNILLKYLTKEVIIAWIPVVKVKSDLNLSE